jgi:hypothetical protein
MSVEAGKPHGRLLTALSPFRRAAAAEDEAFDAQQEVAGSQVMADTTIIDAQPVPLRPRCMQ